MTVCKSPSFLWLHVPNSIPSGNSYKWFFVFHRGMIAWGCGPCLHALCLCAQWQHFGNTSMDRMVSDHAHCQAALRAGCVMVIQLSAAVPALLVRAGTSSFYLEWQQWETSQCTAERYTKYRVPQWESCFLGSARYSTKDFSGLFSRCMDASEVQLKKYLKGMQKWMTGLDATDRRLQSCLHLGFTTLWCFIISSSGLLSGPLLSGPTHVLAMTWF